MLKEVVVLLLFNMLATEASHLKAEKIESRQTSVNILSIWDDAQIKIEEVRSNVSDAILEAFNNLLGIHKELQQSGNVVVTEGKRLITNAKKDKNNELDSIKRLAESVNKNISVCLDTNQNEQKFNELPKETANEMIDCIFLHLNDADNSVANYREGINYFYDRIHKLTTLLQECSPEAITCVAKVVELAKLEQQQIPDEIENIIVAAYNDRANMIVNIRYCPDIKLAQYDSRAKNILDDIEDCVDNI